jgi:hypothetical protein
VTHGGAARALIGTAIGMPPSRYHVLQQSNGGISLLEFGDAGSSSGRLLAANVTDYQETRLPKMKEAKSGVRVVAIPCPPFSVPAAIRETRFRGIFASSPTARDHAAELLETTGLPRGTDVRISPAIPFVPTDGSLRTVLWIVDPATLREHIATILTLPPGCAQRLAVISSSLTVLHRPENEANPTIQGLNLYAGKQE